MAHIGVKRLAAGHRQHHRAQDHEGGPAVCQQEGDAIGRVQRAENGGMADHLHQTQRPQGEEPHHHHRTEQPSDQFGAVALDGEQADQHHQGDGHHEGGEHRRSHLESLHRRQHRDGRRDHAVAEEQGGAHQTQHHQDAHLILVGAGGAQRQGQQSQDAAFAPVVGAHDEQDVFEGDHDDDGPEHQRGDAVDIVRGQRHPVIGIETFLEGVERTGADIAVDHPHGGQRQPPQAAEIDRRLGWSGRRNRGGCFHD